MSETTDSAAPEREWIIRDWDERLTELEERASTARRYALKELDGVIRTLRRQRDEARAELAAAVRQRDEAEAERVATHRLLAEERDGRVRAEATLQAVGMVRLWRNEDGKKFAFADDIAAVLFGKRDGGAG